MIKTDVEYIEIFCYRYQKKINARLYRCSVVIIEIFLN